MWKPTETGVHKGATVQTPDSHLLTTMKGISLDSWLTLSSWGGAQGQSDGLFILENIRVWRMRQRHILRTVLLFLSQGVGTCQEPWAQPYRVRSFRSLSLLSQHGL